MPNRHPIRLLLFFLLLAAACVGVTLLCVRLVVPTAPEWRHDEPNGHAWLHHELGLNAEEAAALDALLPAYQARREALETQFDERVAALAEILNHSETNSPEATAAVHALHAVHSQLQLLAIDHYFEMYAVLPPDKQARLRALAVEALSVPQ